MDRRLKKLSRVELLELMVSMSEDYERLAAENARLKKMVSAQRLPRSTKVGSIAEAALEANNYFEAAQRSADEYLREIKHLRDELAVRAGDARPAVKAASRQREEQARAAVQDAQATARQIVDRANAQAQAILANAKARSEETLANANRQSHAIVAQASQQARTISDAALNTAPPAPVLPDASATGPMPRAGLSYPHLDSVPHVYANPSAASAYQVARVPGASAGLGGEAGLGGAGSYIDNRAYVNRAPAYAGGTAALTPVPDTTAEISPFGERRGNVARGQA